MYLAGQLHLDETQNSYPEPLTLRGVLFIHRHGARTPARLYSTHFSTDWTGWVSPDKHADPYFHLTHLGHQQMQHTGRFLKQLYQERLGLLKANEHPAIYLRASHLTRTVESIKSLCQGFLDDSQCRARVLANLCVKTPETETLYPDEANSTQLREKIAQYRQSGFYQQQLEDYKPIRAKLANQLGIGWQQLPELCAMFDELIARHVHQHHYPTMLSDADMLSLSQLAFNAFYGEYIRSPQTRQLGCSPLYRDVITQLRAIESTETPTKVAIIAGHDSTLVPLLAALGAIPPYWPRLGANISFEVFSQNDPLQTCVVRVLYDNHPYPQHTPMFVPIAQIIEALSHPQ